MKIDFYNTIDGKIFEIKEISILCENVEEVRIIADFLYNVLEFDVYEYKTVERDWEKYPFFSWSSSGFFVQSKINKNSSIIRAEELIKEFKGIKKIRKPEIDPFDEEDWGYEKSNEMYGYKKINESSKKFEVGDIIIANGYLDRILFNNDIGIIICKSYSPAYDWIVEFQDKDNPYLHKCSDNVPSGKGFHMKEKFLTFHSKKYKRIKKPEIDPFDEEDWGYETIE